MTADELRVRWARRDELYRGKALDVTAQEAVRLWRLAEARELEQRHLRAELEARAWVQPVLRGRA
jgi:hypothetical protein